MAPHPETSVIDLERKEELIMAKQLRACRVTILPKESHSVMVMLERNLTIHIFPGGKVLPTRGC